MGKAFLYGNGGAGLNFKVVACASAEALPATARENTIAVLTATAINGYIFSSTEPTEPAEGMVWIITGTSSAVAFSASKKNPVMIYPLSAKQYVGGAWVNLSAMSYQNGSWVDWWDGALFDNGDICEDVTGGWERKAYGGSTGGSVTIGDTIAVAYSGSSVAVCAGTVDMDPALLKDYSYIKADVTLSNAGSGPKGTLAVVADYSLGSSGLNDKFIAYEQKTAAGDYELTLPISDIDEGYILLTAFQVKMDVRKIWLE